MKKVFIFIVFIIFSIFVRAVTTAPTFVPLKRAEEVRKTSSAKKILLPLWEVTCPGRVAPSLGQVTKLTTPRGGGVVTTILLPPRKEVKKGDKILALSSPRMAQLKASLPLLHLEIAERRLQVEAAEKIKKNLQGFAQALETELEKEVKLFPQRARWASTPSPLPGVLARYKGRTLGKWGETLPQAYQGMREAMAARMAVEAQGYSQKYPNLGIPGSSMRELEQRVQALGSILERAPLEAGESHAEAIKSLTTTSALLAEGQAEVAAIKNLGEDGEGGTLTVRAPMDGVLGNLPQRGGALKEGDLLVELFSQEREETLVEVTITPDLTSFSQKEEVTLALNGAVGEVLGVSPLDPANQTATLTGRFEGNLNFSAWEAVRVTVKSAQTKEVWAVSKEAVFKEGGGHFVTDQRSGKVTPVKIIGQEESSFFVEGDLNEGADLLHGHDHDHDHGHDHGHDH